MFPLSSAIPRKLRNFPGNLRTREDRGYRETGYRATRTSLSSKDSRERGECKDACAGIAEILRSEEIPSGARASCAVSAVSNFHGLICGWRDASRRKVARESGGGRIITSTGGKL